VLTREASKRGSFLNEKHSRLVSPGKSIDNQATPGGIFFHRRVDDFLNTIDKKLDKIIGAPAGFTQEFPVRSPQWSKSQVSEIIQSGLNFCHELSMGKMTTSALLSQRFR
jgi:hypothetical protein